MAKDLTRTHVNYRLKTNTLLNKKLDELTFIQSTWRTLATE